MENERAILYTLNMANLTVCLVLFTVLFASISLTSPAHAATPAPSTTAATSKKWIFDVNKGTGKVTFDAIGKPSALKIHGKGEAPKGELIVSSGKLGGAVTFQLDSLDTGIGLRNKHMKERYLEVSKYPEAKLTVTDLPVPDSISAENFSSDSLPFKGTLALHGVEKPVEGTAKVSRQGQSMSVETRIELKTNDFAIAVPSFAGVTMAENVTIQAQITAPFHTN